MARFVVMSLSFGVALFSYRYIAKLGFVPPNVAANRYFNPWLLIHAGAASTALLLGPLQLVDAATAAPRGSSDA